MTARWKKFISVTISPSFAISFECCGRIATKQKTFYMSNNWMLFRKSYKSLSDEDLMEEAQGGNDRALEEIYQRYNQPLLRYFFRMLWQDRDKAEDFLHEQQLDAV